MWGFGFMWLWMLGFWALVIGLVVWAATRVAPSPGSWSPRRDARVILDERFARGEIDADQYRRLRTELTR